MRASGDYESEANQAKHRRSGSEESELEGHDGIVPCGQNRVWSSR
jgi:hypothetical protein